MGCPSCDKKVSLIQKATNIIQGNINALFPNEETKALAEPRLKICYNCSNCKELLRIGNKVANYCTLCKCPVESKTTIIDEKCPIDKW